MIIAIAALSIPLPYLCHYRAIEAVIANQIVRTGLGLTPREQGLALAATCVGATVLARTVDDADFADEICDAARAFMSGATDWEEQKA